MSRRILISIRTRLTAWIMGVVVACAASFFWLVRDHAQAALAIITGGLVLAFPLAWVISRNITRLHLMHYARALEAQDHLERLVAVGHQLTREKDRGKLLQYLVTTAREFADCHSAVIMLVDNDNALRMTVESGHPLVLTSPPIPLPDDPDAPHESLAVRTALSHKTIVVDDVETDPRYELTRYRRYNLLENLGVKSVVSVPMCTIDGRVIGVMQAINAKDPITREVLPFSPQRVAYLEALAAQAATAIEEQKLSQSQTQLTDSLVRMLASAIDAKSPYTGGHCERVPELAMMLARAATNETTGPLASFAFTTEEQWREFRVGAWLHDCGKIATPEHVMDKATKLETVYNRIHEIRTRFEVLWRDARIRALESILAGEPPARATSTMEREHRQLRAEFAFVAHCNIGGEQMATEHMARLRVIAERTWLRHFDDRHGLSAQEAERHGATAHSALPAIESLISDKPWHIVPRGPHDTQQLPDEFRMEVPRHLYNHGELYNLGISRGTLNQEERFKINEHIILTIRMLESTPFPNNLRRVPEYAGTHHETMSGSGYPRGLSAHQLSIPARIMAIADIFEALTASDRPYKHAKTLSESLNILHAMKLRNHIDPDLFDLFLNSGVYLEYARRFLKPEQIDTVDMDRLLDAADTHEPWTVSTT